MQILQKDYEVIQELGKGNFGIAYKVKAKLNGMVYCAKVINSHKFSQKLKQQALNELSIMKELKHPHIVKYIDSIVNDKHLIIIMEYCQYGDLQQHIKERRQRGEHFTEILILNWLMQMINALVYVHQKKIIHRDLKPANIFLDSHAFVKIGDFGVSKILAETIHSSTYTGSPYYMSPEVHSGEKYSNKTDIWSLGCVFWEIASLQTPFKAKSPLEVIRAINECKIKDIPSFYSKLLQLIIKKSMTRDPQRRPNAKQILLDPTMIQIMKMILKESQLKDSQLKKEFLLTVNPKVLENSLETITLVGTEKEDGLLKVIQKAKKEVEARIQKLAKEGTDPSQISAYQSKVKRAFQQLKQKVEAGFRNLREGKIESKAQQTINSIMSNTLLSSIKSDATINSVNLGQQTLANMQRNRQRNVEESDLEFSSTNFSKLDLGNTIKSQAVDQYGNTVNSIRKKYQLDATFKSQVQGDYHNDLGNTFNPGKTLLNTVKSGYQMTLLPGPTAIDMEIQKIQAISREIQVSPSVLLNDSDLSYTISCVNTLGFTLLSGGLLSLPGHKPPKTASEQQLIYFDQMSNSSRNLQKSIRGSQSQTYANVNRQKQMQDILALYKTQLSEIESIPKKNHELILSQIQEDIHENSMVTTTTNSGFPSQNSIKTVSTSIMSRK